ncbi:hypothetical protein SK128_009737 [Halocaridina rubra]|uniref:Uncharacterized protein n=1 Tax=Halocaridina rubra TaxID=373956 RepID=A0AAN9A1T4_HALRR
MFHLLYLLMDHDLVSGLNEIVFNVYLNSTAVEYQLWEQSMEHNITLGINPLLPAYPNRPSTPPPAYYSLPSDADSAFRRPFDTVQRESHSDNEIYTTGSQRNVRGTSEVSILGQGQQPTRTTLSAPAQARIANSTYYNLRSPPHSARF